MSLLNNRERLSLDYAAAVLIGLDYLPNSDSIEYADYLNTRKILLGAVDKCTIDEDRLPLPADIEYHYPYTAPGLINSALTTVSIPDLFKWCEIGNFPKGLLAELPKQSVEQSPTSDADLLGGHRTPEITALIEAVKQFWLNHNPNKPPKSEEVVQWIRENHQNITDNAAKSIDRIIRPEKYRKGGNKPLGSV